MMEEMMDGIEVIHDDDDDLQFADPFSGEPEEPEYFREKRNYIHG